MPNADLNQNPLTELTTRPSACSRRGIPARARRLDVAETTAPSEVPGETLDTLEEYEGMRVTIRP